MGVLVDWQIRQRADLTDMLNPFSEGVIARMGEQLVSYGLSTAGYDLRFGSEVLIYKNTFSEVIDVFRFMDEEYKKRMFDEVKGLKYGQSVTLPPNGYILASSIEHIRVPPDVVGTCVGKSTYARGGVIVNTTPLEPGWRGYLTIEVGNLTPCPIKLYVGQGIAQLRFDTLDAVPEKDYAARSGKYQDQPSGPVPARIQCWFPPPSDSGTA